MSKIGICVKNLTSGGAEKQAILLANALVARHDVTFIILNADKVSDKYLDMLLPEVKVEKYAGSRKQRLAQYREYVTTAAPDIIFSYLTAANYYTVMACRGTNTRVVTGLRNSRLPLMKHIADCLLNRFGAAASVCNCQSGKKHFSRTGFKGSRIEVIPNCLDPIAKYSERDSHDTVRVITVGRFVPQKDYRTAIRAFAEAARKCSRLRFTIIGYGELEESVRRGVEEEGIADRTRILINSDHIAEELRDADIYLSSSIFEGTSNSIMEAMNADMPVIATRVGDNELLLKHGENGYLTATGDFESMAAHIVNLAGNDKLRCDMGRKSKEFLERDYNKSLFAERYNGLITKILSK
ncbi:MAG: glycosyltransferase [Muribaculaceae bacterium]|nr:glycosyltransferase [Muribaculaceae bacterium]